MSDVTRIYEIDGCAYSARQAAPLLADELARVVGERDRARGVAAALEGQVARVIAGVRYAFDPGELDCGRLGFPCRSIHSPDRWCRACRINAALDVDAEA